MNKISVAAVLLVSAFALTATPAQADKRSKDFEKGEAFCPTHVLVVGTIIVQPGRCYVLAVLRNGRGTFLAFLNPSVRLSNRQGTNLDSDDGRKIAAKVIYLVPIGTTGLSAAIPMNTVQLVGIHEEDRHEEEGENNNVDQGSDKVVLVVTGIPIPNLAVTFVVRF
jgi:hypothetical protein